MRIIQYFGSSRKRSWNRHNVFVMKYVKYSTAYSSEGHSFLSDRTCDTFELMLKSVTQTAKIPVLEFIKDMLYFQILDPTKHHQKDNVKFLGTISEFK